MEDRELRTSNLRKAKLELRKKRTTIPKIKLGASVEEPKEEKPKEVEVVIPQTKEEELLERNDVNLQSTWMLYVKTRIPPEKKSLLSLLPVIVPIIDGENLKVIFQSEQQQQKFEEIRPNVLGFVNSRLKQKFTSIVVEVDDSVKLGIDKPYTQQEQFEHMINKSPELKDAISKLGLRLK